MKKVLSRGPRETPMSRKDPEKKSRILKIRRTKSQKKINKKSDH